MNEQDYILFKQFIHKLLHELMVQQDYENIMRRLGANKQGNRYTTICHNVSPKNYNLSYDSNSRLFYCFSSCNCSYNLLNLIKKRFEILNETKSFFQCVKWLCEQLNIPFDFKDEVKKTKSDLYNWQEKLGKYTRRYENKASLPSYSKEILNYFDKKYHSDWVDYGISIETLDKYNIRWYNYRNQIVIPCYDKSGILRGIRVRNMSSVYNAKYDVLRLLDNTEYKFPTNLMFYGENYNSENIRRTKTVMLVEAEKTVLKYDTWFPNNNICLGMFGSTLSKEKLKFLLRLEVETVIIGIDCDYEKVDDENFHNQFENKVFKIYNILKPYIRNIYVLYNNMEFNNCYKFSPTDFTRKQFNLLWENKERIEL